PRAANEPRSPRRLPAQHRRRPARAVLGRTSSKKNLRLEAKTLRDLRPIRRPPKYLPRFAKRCSEEYASQAIHRNAERLATVKAMIGTGQPQTIPVAAFQRLR